VTPIVIQAPGIWDDYFYSRSICEHSEERQVSLPVGNLRNTSVEDGAAGPGWVYEQYIAYEGWW